MKSLPAVLMVLCLGIAPAQAYNRCETADGRVSYQDRPCAEPAPAEAANDAPYDEGARSPRRLAANAAGKAIAVRMKGLNGHAEERRADDRLQNLYRCRAAMQVVALCGSTAADFACDDRGFIAAAGSAAPRARVGNERKNQIQRCAMHASRGPS